MLSEIPRYPKASTCGLCEFSLCFKEEQVPNLVCCTKYETHVDKRQGTCPWYESLSDQDLRIQLQEITVDWIEAQALVEMGDLRSMECIVRQRRHQTGRKLSMSDHHYEEEHTP